MNQVNCTSRYERKMRVLIKIKSKSCTMSFVLNKEKLNINIAEELNAPFNREITEDSIDIKIREEIYDQ